MFGLRLGELLVIVAIAVVAILLIAGQAVVLDAVTTVLFRLVRRRWR